MSKARKIEKDDGTTAYLASDGREFKSKSGAWKHSTKIEEPIEGEAQGGAQTRDTEAGG